MASENVKFPCVNNDDHNNNGYGMFEATNNVVQLCFKCGREPEKMCERCLVPYCSLRCQRLDWPDHMKLCPMPALIPFVRDLDADVRSPVGQPMTGISQLPREVIEIILAKLDCAYDISSCALVCKDWLGIINDHPAIETSTNYNYYDNNRIPYQLRRFKNIIFTYRKFTLELSKTDVDVLQKAKKIEFLGCKFPNLAALKECVLACGNLSRLVIDDPELENWQMMENTDCISKSQNHQKIETLELRLWTSSVPGWHILEMFHKSSIDVVNLELHLYNYDTEDELRPLFGFLEKHYQDKLRSLEVCDGSSPLEFLQRFSSLRLKNINLSHWDLERASELLRSQPSVTELVLYDLNYTEIALQHFPNMLTELVLFENYSPEHITVISQNTHLLRTLRCLKLHFNYDSSCDITFIAKLPNLQIFSGQFHRPIKSVNLGPIEKPMLQMKAFHLICTRNVLGVHIDAASMWNIFHQMPNLEQLTLEEETAQPCPFGPLNALKKLAITAAIIEDDEAVQSMALLKNLRYLELTHTSNVTLKTPKVQNYFGKISQNCPLLMQIKWNRTLIKRDADGEFKIGVADITFIMDDMVKQFLKRDESSEASESD